NIHAGGAAKKQNPKPGDRKSLPRTVAHFEAHEALLSKIFEYHDVSKHRSEISTGGSLGTLHIRGDPQQPHTLMSSTVHTLESLAHDFEKFFDVLLPITLQELA